MLAFQIQKLPDQITVDLIFVLTMDGGLKELLDTNGVEKLLEFRVEYLELMLKVA